jgi:hypothetical protein
VEEKLRVPGFKSHREEGYPDESIEKDSDLVTEDF